MPCKVQTVLQLVNAVQLQLMHSLLDVTPYHVIDRIKVGAIRRPEICRNKTGVNCSKIAQCCVPGVQVCWLVERLRNRLTLRASRETAAALISPWIDKDEVREAKL